MNNKQPGSIPRKTMINDQPHMLAYINPREAMMLKSMGGAGKPGPGGVPAFYYGGDFGEGGRGAGDSGPGETGGPGQGPGGGVINLQTIPDTSHRVVVGRVRLLALLNYKQ